MELEMPKVYCAYCKHFDFYKEKGSLGIWVCGHPSNVGSDYKDNWLSWGNIKTYTAEPSVKNADNDCGDYEVVPD